MINQEKKRFIEKYEAMEDYIKAKKQVTMGNPNIEHATDKELKSIPLNEAVEFQIHRYEDDLEVLYFFIEQFNNLKSISEQIEEKYFDQFEFFLKSNVNVLVYGFGSKYDLLEKFTKEKFIDLPVITINGFSKYISIRHILESLYQLVSGYSKQFHQKKIDTERPKRFEEQIAFFGKFLNELTDIDQILIVFHQIDGLEIRDSYSQSILSKLFQIKKIICIASFDHIKYSTILTTQIFEQYNFVFFNLNTCAFYENEFVFQENLISKQSENKKALNFIWKSLTTHQKEILKLIAQYVLQNVDNQNFLGIKESLLLDKCYEEMLLSNPTQLKENLKEVIDHKVVQVRKNERNIYYSMKYQEKLLQKIIDDEFENEDIFV